MKLFIKKIPDVVCAVIFIFFIGTTVFLIADSRGNNIDKPSAELNLNWFMKDGTEVGNVQKLNMLSDASTNKEQSIYTVIPDNIPKGGELSFRSKHLFYSVYIDGKNIYTLHEPESRLYTNSAGVTWAMLPLSAEDAGKTLELRYRICYAGSPCGIDSIKIEVGHDLIMDIIREKLAAFLTSLIYLILSAAFLAADIPISRTLNKSHSFLYLGLITFSVTLFCITETQLIQVFIENKRIIHLITCYSLMLGPMPVVLYANSIFPFRYKYTLHLFAAFNMIIFLSLTIFNIAGPYDYHDTLFIVHADILAAIGVMVLTIIRHIIAQIKEKKKPDTYTFLEISGLSCLMLTGIIDVCRYYYFNSGDPAKYVRIGILLFIIFFAASNFEKINSALVLNARNELIAKLAYEDGLTGLYNRTAYNEALEGLQKKHKYIGICGFDVNNLKKINDNIGHDMGDNLIKESSDIIRTAFCDEKSLCFRTGGDEFMAVLYGDNIEKRIRDSIDKLYSLCDEFNRIGNYPFKISIASGSSIYDGTESIETVVKEADRLMYEHKKEMKEMFKDCMADMYMRTSEQK